MKLIIDSSAWIEYLIGSSKGESVYNFLRGDNEIYVLPIIISEVISSVKRNNEDFNLAFRVISSYSRLFELSAEVSKEAGVIHADTKRKISSFGLADAIIISANRKLNTTIVTCDEHFRTFKNTIVLK